MPGSGNDHFGVSISDLKQRRTFPFKGFLSGDIIADLDIDFLAASLRYKVDFFLIQLSDIDIIATAQKLDADHVFIYSAVVHVSAAQDRIADAGVAQIELFRAFQIFLATDVVPLNVIENKGVAQILDISAHGNMAGGNIICFQQLADLVGRSQVADIVHEELAESLKHQCIRQRILLHQISGDNSFIDLFDIVRPVFFRTVSIGTGQTSLDGIVLKELISVGHIVVILAILPEAEGEHMDFNISPGKEGRQIGTQQKRIGAGYIDVVLTLGIEAVDCQLKLRAHLNLVHKEVIGFSRYIMPFYIGMEGVVFFDFLKLQIHEVDEDDVDIFAIRFQIFNICLHQLGLAGATNAGDDLDIRCAIQFDDSVEVMLSDNRFHMSTHFQKMIFFRVLKLFCCRYYTV